VLLRAIHNTHTYTILKRITQYFTRHTRVRILHVGVSQYSNCTSAGVLGLHDTRSGRAVSNVRWRVTRTSPTYSNGFLSCTRFFTHTCRRHGYYTHKPPYRSPGYYIVYSVGFKPGMGNATSHITHCRTS